MNYLHNGLNHDPFGAYTFRQGAAMCLGHSISFLEDETTFTEIRHSKKIVNELLKIHEEQQVKQKWYQRFKKPKLGNKPLHVCKEGFIHLGTRRIWSDCNVLNAVIWEYDFKYLDAYPELRELISQKFNEITNNIVQNYEFYATNQKVSLEKILNLYLTCLTGIYFMNEDCPKYDEQEFKITGFHGKHNEPVLLAEKLIGEERGKTFTYAAEKYDEAYNKHMNGIVYDTCMAIIRAWR